MSSLPFESAAATVLGREHARVGRNNQDAFHTRASAQGLVAVVTDGCGSGAASEVGARLGAWRAVDTALTLLAEGVGPDAPGFLALLEADLLGFLKGLAGQLGPEAVGEALLFTLVGAVCTPSHVLLFAAGDGLWALNGEVHRLGPFPGNAPPYLGYGVLRPGLVGLKPLALRPTAAVDSLLLGTDGAVDLLDEPGGPLSRFWREDRYFTNPDALRRHLALLNRETVRADFPGRRLVRETGRLGDDTTLVVLRRIPREA